MSSVVSAGFFDWIRGGNDLKDVTGAQVASGSISGVRSASAGTSTARSVPGILRLGSLQIGSKATLSRGKSLSSSSTTLSVVSSSSGRAALRLESTITVKNGQIIELGGLQYRVSINPAGVDQTAGVGEAASASVAGLASPPGEDLVTLVKVSGTSQTPSPEPGEGSPGRCTQAPEGGNDRCTDELVSTPSTGDTPSGTGSIGGSSGRALGDSIDASQTDLTKTQIIAPVTSTSLFSKLTSIFR